VKPELVAEVEFTEWTRDTILRELRIVGIREDKSPAEVVLEPTVGRRSSVASAPGPASTVGWDGPAVVRGVHITNAERMVYLELGVSKLAVAEY
jgi:bifunctional non-homologous end joining protein LigD